MKLGDILQSKSVWDKLVGMQLPPRDAYSILKYARVVSQELELIEKQRVALIHDLTDTAEGEDVRIEPDTDLFRKWIEKFNDILIVDADMPQFDMTMDEFLLTLDALSGVDNELSAKELAILEPFFKD